MLTMIFLCYYYCNSRTLENSVSFESTPAETASRNWEIIQHKITSKLPLKLQQR